VSRPGVGSRLVDDLERSGDLYVLGPGRIAVAGRLLAVCDYFDECFRRLARRLGAVQHDYPDLISIAQLDRLEFFASFPHLATFAAPFESAKAAVAGSPRNPQLAEPDCALAPAVCYHTFTCLEGFRLTSQPYTVTARGRCCRFEGPALERTPVRLWSFTMREIVAFGTAGDVERIRRRLSRAALRLAEKSGLSCRLAPASDPFFLAESRGKALAQRLNGLKLELLASLSDGTEIAVASFNLHQDFFSTRMQISLPSGETAQSGCSAFGIERWGYAFLDRNGTKPEKWPAEIRRHYARHAPR
jgi:hypothetical protein